MKNTLGRGRVGCSTGFFLNCVFCFSSIWIAKIILTVNKSKIQEQKNIQNVMLLLKDTVPRIAIYQDS